MNTWQKGASILQTSIRTRFRLVVLLTASVGVIAAVGAGLTRAAQPPTIPTVPGLPTTGGYNAKVEFDVSYEVKWSKTSGNPAQNCSPWTATSGTTMVNAGTVDPVLGHVQAFTGGVQTRNSWGNTWAVGNATGTVDRTLVQNGGYKWSANCGYPKPRPFRAPENDCRERPFTAPTASIRSELHVVSGRGAVVGRLDNQTLDESVPRGVKEPVLTFSIRPSSVLYGRCETTGYAPQFPAPVWLYVYTADRIALKKLKPGMSQTLANKFGGYCTTQDLPEGETCTFKLDLRVRIRRVA